MTVRVNKPAINLREELADLRKPTGIAGEAMLRAETPQEQFNLIGAGRRNLIINGAMQVAQRGTSVTGVTDDGYYTCDRIKFRADTLGTWTIEQSTNAPSGFSSSIKATCTTADASPAAGDTAQLFYAVEAQDLQLLGFGTPEAKSMTLSFWVKSNKTGNATATLMLPDASYKLISAQYTVNNADTWEYKVITVLGDTANNIENNNGLGLEIEVWMNTGSNHSSGSHQTTWSSYSIGNRSPSNLGVGGAVNDYFQITGVQLELGKVATPFEHRSYGEELAACRRYYQIYGGGGSSYVTFMHLGSYNSNSAAGVFKLDSTMRTAPTVSTVGNFQASNYVTQSVSSFIGVTSYDGNLVTIGIQGNGSNFINGGMLRLRAENDTTARFMFDAEL